MFVLWLVAAAVSLMCALHLTKSRGEFWQLMGGFCMLGALAEVAFFVLGLVRAMG